MDSTNPSDLQIKYQKLATEYSKLRSQAQVLRKGVVDEQSKNSSLTEILKEYEQRVRKSDLEMESLNFRNQQLTKRIIVLQDELDKQSKVKKGKNSSEGSSGDFYSASRNNVIDEELRHKIIENAQLLTTISDKDVIISTLEDRLKHLENQIENIHSSESSVKQKQETELNKLKSELLEMQSKLSTANDVIKQLKLHNGESRSDIVSLGSEDTTGSATLGDLTTLHSNINEQLTQAKQQIVSLKQELETYKAKCKSHSLQISESFDDQISTNGDNTTILGSIKSPSHISMEDVQERERKLNEYFLERINELVKEKEQAKSVCDNVVVECNAVEERLNESLTEKFELEERLRATEITLDSLQEELSTTSHNYELQLSTMSEHLANMNETLTKQCDEIHQLEYKLKLKRQNK